MRWYKSNDILSSWHAEFVMDSMTHTAFIRNITFDDENTISFRFDTYDKPLYRNGRTMVMAMCQTSPDGLRCIHDGHDIETRYVVHSFAEAKTLMPNVIASAERFAVRESCIRRLRIL